MEGSRAAASLCRLHPGITPAPHLHYISGKVAVNAYLPAARAKLGEGAAEAELAAESRRMQGMAAGALG